MKWVCPLIILLLLVALASFIVKGKTLTNVSAPSPVPAISTAPTDFVQTGIISFPASEEEIGPPYLTYHDEGPTTSLKLVLDPLSICMSGTGATPCIAMSVTLDVPFNGKTALVEGIRQGNEVLVRKLRVLPDGEIPPIPQPGDTFISWTQAVSHLERCEVQGAMQTHGLDVYLTLKDGRRVRAVEPTIDELFAVSQRTLKTCGSISIGTE